MNEREYKAEIEALKQRIAELEKTEIELPPPPHPRWMPMEDEHYWYINDVPHSATWDNDICDANWYELGNVFKTREAAEFAAERLKVLAEMREWAGNWDAPYILQYLYEYKRITTCVTLNSDGAIRFNKEKDAENCVKAVGKERLKKYYFMITEDED